MQIKPGASIAGLDIKMRPALKVADDLWDQYNRELVVTAGLDGAHSAGSLHYYGLAVDFRTNYFEDQKEMKEVADTLRQRLTAIDPHFEVSLHKTHIHVEYDDV